MRFGAALCACLLLGATLASADRGDRLKEFADAAEKSINGLLDHAREEARAAAEAFAAKHPDGLIARHLIDGDQKGRRLMTLGGGLANWTSDIHSFFSNMLGNDWAQWVPEAWSSPSFDWSHLGEFDYGSNLGDFLDAHDVANMTHISGPKDLHATAELIEAAFCTPEEHISSVKVPASCTGPSVTLAVTPKVCILDHKAKQVVCDPAKLVLVKTPGSCVHSYHSASGWVGKECKLKGGAGFSDRKLVGGGVKHIPLTQIDIGYEYK